ncbi:hypothetical protein [Haloarchaeobius sp. DFWS5]|uniref:hypothetical protein n=1 Tax=Haloarchaeobius sp. DFWS5 TaxID=3446114 RepID=UPI003EBDA2C6
MKVKHVPAAPDSLDFVESAQRAVPLVPGSEDDCCARLIDRTDIVARDDAATWLTFMRGLGLAEEGERGFSRIRREPTADYLREAIVEGIFGVADVLEILREADDAGDGPLSLDSVFDRFEDTVPRWERHKHPNDWRHVWTEKVEHELDWLVLLDLAEKTDDGYRAV